MSSTASSKTILIGDLLVRSEMTTPRTMADAVPISLKTGLPIGRVLIGAGALTETHLQQALMAQSLVRDSLLSADLAVQALRIVVKENFDLDQALNIVGWHPESFTSENRLGQLLLDAKVINEAQLEDCLRIFYSAGLPLARVLVLKGTITNLVAYVALTSQQMLRDNKLSREQAIQSVQAAKASRGIIEHDYIEGYLRLQPANNIRLGELFVRANLVEEKELIDSVEAAITKAITLGEVLIERGVINEDTLARALETQRLVTEGFLDVAKSGEVLRRANHKRMSAKEMMSKLHIDLAPEDAVLQTLPQKPLAPHRDEDVLMQTLTPNSPLPWETSGEVQTDTGEVPTMQLPLQDESATSPSITNPSVHAMQEVRDILTSTGNQPTNKRRSFQEMKARELVRRLQAKLDALNTRNDYLGNMLDSNMPKLRITAEAGDDYKHKKIADFDSAMQFIEELFGLVESSAYRNGYLLSRVDSVSEKAALNEKVSALELQLASAYKELESAKYAQAESEAKLKDTSAKLQSAEKDLMDKVKSSNASRIEETLLSLSLQIPKVGATDSVEKNRSAQKAQEKKAMTASAAAQSKSARNKKKGR